MAVRYHCDWCTRELPWNSVRYHCDWCTRELPWNSVSTVKVKNVYSKTATLHICRDCARSHMPEHLQGMLSWTELA